MKKISRILLGGLLIIGLTTSQLAWAGYVPSSSAMTTQQTEQQRSDIISLIDRQDVRDALQAKGLSAEEAKDRVAMLTPSQVEQLNTELETLPAGEGAVGAIIAAVLIVFFVLLFTDLVGETDAYDFDD